jgi:hypothetical protein
MKNFLGIIAKPEPWLNIFYNLISFPLGIFYFVFLFTGIILIFPVLHLFNFFSKILGQFASVLLGDESQQSEVE